jgi:hypothetical protein
MVPRYPVHCIFVGRLRLLIVQRTRNTVSRGQLWFRASAVKFVSNLPPIVSRTEIEFFPKDAQADAVDASASHASFSTCNETAVG